MFSPNRLLFWSVLELDSFFCIFFVRPFGSTSAKVTSTKRCSIIRQAVTRLRGKYLKYLRLMVPVPVLIWGEYLQTLADCACDRMVKQCTFKYLKTFLKRPSALRRRRCSRRPALMRLKTDGRPCSLSYSCFCSLPLTVFC